MFWKLALFCFSSHLHVSFSLHAEEGYFKAQATFSGNNTGKPNGSHFSHHHPCVRARKGAVRAWVCMGVHLCVRLFMRAPLFSSRLTRATPPFVLNTSCSFSCPWHALLLPSSSTPGVARCIRVSRFSVSFLKRAAPPLVLNTNRRALSCHAQLLFQESCAPFTASRQ